MTDKPAPLINLLGPDGEWLDGVARRRAILAAKRPPLTPRSCMDCDNIYRGDLECPACGNHSGEPLNG